MKFKFLQKAFVASTCLLLAATQTDAQITVNDNQSAQALVDMLVGPGVATSNAVLNCAGVASGKFSGPSNLGIDSGIVLGSGIANTAGAVIGLNGAASQSVSLGGVVGTDADLLAMANYYLNTSSSSVHSPCVLEFDFIPKGDTVKFDYVFASEEYNTYVCSGVNDGFALLISGPGIIPNGPLTNKRNVALVPGTNTPVMINTINAGNSISSQCTDIDPNGPYTQYFVNNINLAGTTVAYNGFTTVLTAEAVVIPCETYHLKFAISNVGDNAFQSAVMIKAGSLTSTNIQTVQTSGEGANSDLLHVVRGCKSAELQYQRTDCDTMLPFTFHFEIGGTAVPGADYQTIPNTLSVPGGTSISSIFVKGLLAPPTGPRYVTIGVKHPDSVLVNAPIIPIIQTDTVWIFDSLYVDISTPPITVCPNTPITIEAHTSSALNYNWNPVNFNGSLTINPNMITTRAYTITVTQPGAPSTCPPNSRTYVAVVEQYPNIFMSTDTTVCIEDSVAIPVLVGPDSVNYIYKWTPATGLRADNIATNYFSAPPGTYNYNIEVTTPEAGCSRDHNFQITAVLPEKFTNVRPVSGTTYEYNDVINFSATGNFLYYTWYPTESFVDPYWNNNQTRALETMNYYVVGIDKYGCKDTADVLINVEFPPNPIIPNAFTPNGDGRNDMFLIPGNDFNKVLRFEVYNRWGQRVFHTFDKMKGWDGLDENNGQACGQGVYMYIFTAEMPNKEIKTYRGDVTLMR